MKGTLLIGTDHNLDFFRHMVHKTTDLFIDSLQDHNLLPWITCPTRITHSSATLIDNILISNKVYGLQKSCILIHDISDHLPCLLLQSAQKLNKSSKITRDKQDQSPKAVNSLKVDLSEVDWSVVVSPTSTVDEQFDSFHKKLLEVVEKNCPTTTLTIGTKGIIKEPWLTKGIINSNKKQL